MCKSIENLCWKSRRRTVKSIVQAKTQKCDSWLANPMTNTIDRFCFSDIVHQSRRGVRRMSMRCRIKRRLINVKCQWPILRFRITVTSNDFFLAKMFTFTAAGPGQLIRLPWFIRHSSSSSSLSWSNLHQYNYTLNACELSASIAAYDIVW